MVDPLAPLRAEILAATCGRSTWPGWRSTAPSNHAPEETFESARPGRLEDLSTAQSALAEFYGIRHA